ncbi:MAG: ribosomal-protein-alanine N-acetyltransferase [Firmicutes bacterium]|nr:ribosomal-protein-alanine N-acetyltransferase [Bacillota bacterium]
MISEVEKDNKTLVQFLIDNNIERPINSPFSKEVVYIENGVVIGYLSYSIMYEKAEINEIFVLNSSRGQGIGSQLLEYLLNKCQFCENITLEVRKNNEAAISLYKKYGFKEVALRKNYYNNIDGILMMREGE